MSSEFSRRTFLGAGAALSATPAAAQGRMKLAMVGTGHRGSGMWGSQLLEEHGHQVQYVGLCDINPKRIEAAKKLMGVAPPAYTDFDKMIRETKPDTVVVTTKDSTHHLFIIRAMELGSNVITEKPMTTTAEACQAILDAEKKFGKKITVGFNYRYAPTAEKMKSLIMSGAIGTVVSVDFHWYLDTSHGADYFRRWHAYRENSGTLFVHKATHHFDLINWYLAAEPVEVSAQGFLRHYGKNGKIRGVNCRKCQFTSQCKFRFDLLKDKRLAALYADAEDVDGYYRDGCIYREDINIYDTMTAQMRYSNGAIMSYSLNACMPYEGYHLAFNGTEGRIEVRVYEKQPWPAEPIDDIRFTRNFGKSEIIRVAHGKGGHFGGDPKLKNMIFDPAIPDPLHQRAGARAGAMSLLTGVAADKSVQTGKPIKIADLVRL